MAGNQKGNPQNLTPFNVMDSEKKKAVQSKGGKKSAQKRRERKALKDELLTALKVVTEDGKTVQEKGVEALLERFLKGDPKVFEIVRDSIGEKPTDKQEVKIVDSEWFK